MTEKYINAIKKENTPKKKLFKMQVTIGDEHHEWETMADNAEEAEKIAKNKLHRYTDEISVDPVSESKD